MDSQEPAATFVSKIQLISEFVKELFDNDDFKEERVKNVFKDEQFVLW